MSNQLSKRITKLELAMSDTEGVCECLRPKVEIYFTKEQPDGTFSEPTLNNEPIPNICDRCLRPIEKDEILVKFVKSKITPPEGAHA